MYVWRETSLLILALLITFENVYDLSFWAEGSVIMALLDAIC